MLHLLLQGLIILCCCCYIVSPREDLRDIWHLWFFVLVDFSWGVHLLSAGSNFPQLDVHGCWSIERSLQETSKCGSPSLFEMCSNHNQPAGIGHQPSTESVWTHPTTRCLQCWREEELQASVDSRLAIFTQDPTKIRTCSAKLQPNASLAYWADLARLDDGHI